MPQITQLYDRADFNSDKSSKDGAETIPSD